MDLNKLDNDEKTGVFTLKKDYLRKERNCCIFKK